MSALDAEPKVSIRSHQRRVVTVNHLRSYRCHVRTAKKPHVVTRSLKRTLPDTHLISKRPSSRQGTAGFISAADGHWTAATDQCRDVASRGGGQMRGGGRAGAASTEHTTKKTRRRDISLERERTFFFSQPWTMRTISHSVVYRIRAAVRLKIR